MQVKIDGELAGSSLKLDHVFLSFVVSTKSEDSEGTSRRPLNLDDKTCDSEGKFRFRSGHGAKVTFELQKEYTLKSGSEYTVDVPVDTEDPLITIELKKKLPHDGTTCSTVVSADDKKIFTFSGQQGFRGLQRPAAGCTNGSGVSPGGSCTLQCLQTHEWTPTKCGADGRWTPDPATTYDFILEFFFFLVAEPQDSVKCAESTSIVSTRFRTTLETSL